MKTSITKTVLGIILCALTLMGSTLSAYADGSHGFYMDCDASVVDNRADGFMIDFYSDSAEALCTYWSNANWSMDTTTTSKILGTQLTGGGAYAGLQIKGTADERAGIMSLWRYEYRDKSTGDMAYIYAKALFGKTTTYDNEGSGTSCVMPYNWKSGQWYRELLLCWTDRETGNTFIGTWFYDYEADNWTLFAYYNTFLQKSFIKGGIGQFLENYSESQGARYRSFRYRNVYFLSHDSGEWVSSPTVSLRSDGNPKAFGEAKLGVSPDNTYVWASVDGTSEVDTDHVLSVRPTLTQSEKPAVGSPSIATFKVKDSGAVQWKMDEHSTPQLSYKFTATDINGKLLKQKSGTRPETVYLKFNEFGTDAYKCTLTITDVFGQTTTATYLSEGYQALSQPQKDPDTTPTKNAKTSNAVWIAASVGGAVLVIVGALSVVLIIKKRKAKSK